MLLEMVRRYMWHSRSSIRILNEAQAGSTDFSAVCVVVSWILLIFANRAGGRIAVRFEGKTRCSCVHDRPRGRKCLVFETKIAIDGRPLACNALTNTGATLAK